MNLEELQKALLGAQQSSISAQSQLADSDDLRASTFYPRWQGVVPMATNAIRRKMQEPKRQELLEQALNSSGQVAELERQLAEMQARQQQAEEAATRFEDEALLQQGGYTNPQARMITRGYDLPEQAKPDEYAKRARVGGEQGLEGDALRNFTLTGELPDNQDGIGDFDTGQKLRKEFLSETKDFAKQTDSYGRVLASGKEPSAAGDLALIFNYMKVLDPGSVVRESEFENAARSGSLPARVQAAANKIYAGERLSNEMRMDFINRAGKLYQDALGLYERRKNEYHGLAQRYGYDPAKIFIDRPSHEVPQDLSGFKILSVE